MVRSISVVGAGRVGSAVAARLEERGVELLEEGAELVLLCVPDRAIAEVFSVHPLQTIVRRRGPEQLDGAWAAVTAETSEARELGFELARLLGLEPFELADADRPLYHAAATFVSGYLVTLYRTAASLFEEVGAPPEALLPLMQRTIDNDFELTGPIARGDWTTVESHAEALRIRRPELEPLYRALAEATNA